MERDEREAALGELRKRLEDGLARAGLDKTQLAARTRRSRTTVHEAFRAGGPVPSAMTVAALARALRLPADELLDLRRASAGEAGDVHAVEAGPGKPIGEWDPHDLEVHPAGTATPGVGSGARSHRELPGYVRRAHDQILAEAVREAAEGLSRMLVLVGSSSTGKTRACWEAVQPLAAEGWRLWHPYDPTPDEAALAGLGGVPPRTVVWLNEAQRYLGRPRAGERIAAALHTLLTDSDRQPVLVLGTLWLEYAGSYTLVPGSGAPDRHSRARELLTGRTITVPDTFDPEALHTATALAQGGDRFLTDALTRARTHGRLAQELAGAPELVRRYEQGTPPSRALLEAAMDARRLGVGLPLPQAFLIDAATDYLTDHDYDQLTEDWAEAAFAELARPIHGTSPLRRTTTRPPRRPPSTPAHATTPAPAPGPVFRLADYLEQRGRTTRRRRCPPASFWRAATHLTNPDDLYNLAKAAEDRHRLQWAHCLWRRAADVGHPQGPVRLAVLRAGLGDYEPAQALLLKAFDTGHPLVIEWAVGEEAEDLERAKTLFKARTGAEDQGGPKTRYRQAADTGEHCSLTDLGRMREIIGDLEGAAIRYRRAADAGEPSGLTDLGRLREIAGDLDGAATLYQQAADAGRPSALLHMARLRAKAGDLEGAETLVRLVVNTDHPDALFFVAGLREEAGDLKGAETLYLQAADAGQPLPYLLSKERWPFGLDPDGSPTPCWI
ncbi:helix-turn-helix domain-containing protein [Kitasatospora sp. NPDC056651]|uniref:helix-turn-helix domain-containing protein n=1 Tax=Kitasatospora sp. NPDC056651 TaxID=3345892 RepID=UPI0036AC5239